MAIRTYLTLEEADALDAAVRKHRTRLRYIVRDAIHDWVFNPTTGRNRLSPIEKEPGEPYREISALIPNWYYGALKWKSIGAGFHMREAFREAILQWLALDAEGWASVPTTQGNAAWIRARFRREIIGEERFRATMQEVVDAQEANVRPMDRE
jgi:hypothetical protein